MLNWENSANPYKVNSINSKVSYNEGGYELWTYNPNVPISDIPYFTLVNADTNEDLRWIQEGDTIVKYPGDLINIRYNPAETVGSVKFILNGSIVRVENQSPYALAGDNGEDYNAWLPSSPGHYTLTAEKYSSSNASGTLLGTTTIHFYIRTETFGHPPVVDAGEDQFIPLPATSATLQGYASDIDGSITSVSWSLVYGPDTYSGSPSFSDTNSLNTIVNNLSTAGEYKFRLAATDDSGLTSYDDVKVTITGQEIAYILLINSERRIFELTDGVIIDIAGMSNNFTMHIFTNPLEVGSVKIILDGVERIENNVPYTTFGYSNDYIFRPLSIGEHTITATPYTERDAKGIAGITTSITFTIINSDVPTSTLTAFPDNAQLLCYPNPSSGSFHIKVPSNGDGNGSVFIYDVNGVLIKKLFEGTVMSSSEMNMEWHADKPGIYFLKAKIGIEEHNQKLIAY